MGGCKFSCNNFRSDQNEMEFSLVNDKKLINIPYSEDIKEYNEKKLNLDLKEFDILIDKLKPLISQKFSPSFTMSNDNHNIPSLQSLETDIQELFNYGKNAFYSLLISWKKTIYKSMCKKRDSEIKTFISLSNDSSILKITHKVNNWKDITLLKQFSLNKGLHIDHSVINEVDYLIDSSTNASISLCINLKCKLNDEAYLNSSRTSELNIKNSNIAYISLSFAMKSHRDNLNSFLMNIEKKDKILSWFAKYNSLIPTEFTYNLNSKKRERACEFYIHDPNSKYVKEFGISAIKLLNQNDDKVKKISSLIGNNNYLFVSIGFYKNDIYSVELKMKKFDEFYFLNCEGGMTMEHLKWDYFKSIFGAKNLKRYSLFIPDTNYINREQLIKLFIEYDIKAETLIASSSKILL